MPTPFGAREGTCLSRETTAASGAEAPTTSTPVGGALTSIPAALGTEGARVECPLLRARPKDTREAGSDEGTAGASRMDGALAATPRATAAAACFFPLELFAGLTSGEDMTAAGFLRLATPRDDGPSRFSSGRAGPSTRATSGRLVAWRAVGPCLTASFHDVAAPGRFGPVPASLLGQAGELTWNDPRVGTNAGPCPALGEDDAAEVHAAGAAVRRMDCG
mmetsp:Transcript_30603/g.88929  ORF Transcript_30603/g.88929 Transcript_30603/m.88929 type:complete len:220 (-) Transcript_30603:226-885(-)